MTPRSVDPQPQRRRRIPPPGLVILAGVLFLGLAGFRFYAESSRPWEIQAVAGVVFIVGGLVFAAVKRSFR